MSALWRVVLELPCPTEMCTGNSCQPYPLHHTAGPLLSWCLVLLPRQLCPPQHLCCLLPAFHRFVPGCVSYEHFRRAADLVQTRAFHMTADNWITGAHQVGEKGSHYLGSRGMYIPDHANLGQKGVYWVCIARQPR